MIASTLNAWPGWRTRPESSRTHRVPRSATAHGLRKTIEDSTLEIREQHATGETDEEEQRTQGGVTAFMRLDQEFLDHQVEQRRGTEGDHSGLHRSGKQARTAQPEQSADEEQNPKPEHEQQDSSGREPRLREGASKGKSEGERLDRDGDAEHRATAADRDGDTDQEPVDREVKTDRTDYRRESPRLAVITFGGSGTERLEGQDQRGTDRETDEDRRDAFHPHHLRYEIDRDRSGDDAGSQVLESGAGSSPDADANREQRADDQREGRQDQPDSPDQRGRPPA